MKKLYLLLTVVLLSTTTSILVPQSSFKAYLMEYGTIDSNNTIMSQKGCIDLDVTVEMNESNFIVHTKEKREYYFYSTIQMYQGDTLFVCSSMVIDHDAESALFTYHYNRFSNRRTVLIKYNRTYLKYYITT